MRTTMKSSWKGTGTEPVNIIKLPYIPPRRWRMSLGKKLDRAFGGGEEDEVAERPPSLSELVEEGQRAAHIDRGFLRPSGIMGCDRQNVFRLLRAPESPDVLKDCRINRVLDNGTAIHAVIQKYLGALPDYWFAPESKIQVEVHGVLVRGSCAGILIRRSDCYRFGVEIKTMKHDMFVKLDKPNPDHVAQASLYAKLHGVKWITILYWDKDQQHLKEYAVQAGKRWPDIKKRVVYLRDLAYSTVSDKELHWRNMDLSKLVAYNPDKCSPDFCAHWEFCRDYCKTPIQLNRRKF